MADPQQQQLSYNPERQPGPQTHIQVLDRTSSTLMTVPREDVSYIPDSKRLVLCERYDPANAASCRYTAGGQCRFVHANLSRATRQVIHVNLVWRNANDIPYERYPP